LGKSKNSSEHEKKKIASIVSEYSHVIERVSNFIIVFVQLAFNFSNVIHLTITYILIVFNFWKLIWTIYGAIISLKFCVKVLFKMKFII
jgi:hypothetical protein